MIECWFSTNGYAIKGDKFTSTAEVEPSDDSYTTNWYIFNSIIELLLPFADQLTEIIVYHDSRLIEELTNQLEPYTEYAIDSRRYFLLERPKFKKITFVKSSNYGITMAIRELRGQERLQPSAINDSTLR